MPLDNQKVLMNEIKIKADYPAAGKLVMELALPFNTIISCIIRDTEVIVVFMTWLIVIVITAVPFVMTGQYSFTQAVFETTSGLSTTGLSVVDTAKASHIFLIHRTVLLFFGGIGLVLVMTSVLSEVYGMRLYHAEGHSDRLLPNLLESSRLIIGIYSGYILSGTLLYVLFGMSPFDAVNHAVAALSTGGFSTHPESIGYYDSQAIEIITVVLYLMACTVPAVAVLLFLTFGTVLPESFRAALFQVVSALTTTGLQTVETFETWTTAGMFLGRLEIYVVMISAARMLSDGRNALF